MFEQQFQTPEPVRLEIRLAAGDIEVATTESADSRVVLEGSEKAIEAIRVELVGDRLVIEQKHKGFSGWFGRWEAGLSLTVSVPHHSRVEIATASSDARLDGTFGGLQAKLASGRVAVLGEIDGDAHVSSVSGEVRLPRLTGHLRTQTVSGDISVESVGGTAVVKSVSGDVRIGSLSQGRVEVHSVSGDVELGIAAGTNVDIDAGSASGELSTEVPLSSAPSGASGPMVVIRGGTVSGDLRVLRAA